MPETAIKSLLKAQTTNSAGVQADVVSPPSRGIEYARRLLQYDLPLKDQKHLPMQIVYNNKKLNVSGGQMNSQSTLNRRMLSGVCMEPGGFSLLERDDADFLHVMDALSSGAVDELPAWGSAHG
ncbi:hypothetical protein [Phyllobacterium salinisoli]|uniref:hypothetical protein n=1 Tax=Phyllobacterium salinisoli TaxID=1899321 RepID=UPI0011C07718|nr:hypothetical protein [Phyllobacterium salinisoli]